MKTEKKILIAFILNISFSIIEIIGGLLTNSIAILSDSIHDFGDSLSIGLSYFLEKKSKKEPDKNYTYGYARYSILGAFITTTILLIGSSFIIFESIKRVINPVIINYNGMIIFAILGVIINFLAAYFTKDGDSINQKAVNLHMLEDVLGWLIVLIGSIIIKFTDLTRLDSIISILVSLFIFINAIKNYKSIVDLFLEKVPNNISIDEIKNHLLKIDNIIDIHHIHIWSIDGINNYATMHVVTNDNNVKNRIREELKKRGICHVTIELEDTNEKCDEIKCDFKHSSHIHHH